MTFDLFFIAILGIIEVIGYGIWAWNVVKLTILRAKTRLIGKIVVFCGKNGEKRRDNADLRSNVVYLDTRKMLQNYRIPKQYQQPTPKLQQLTIYIIYTSISCTLSAVLAYYVHKLFTE